MGKTKTVKPEEIVEKSYKFKYKYVGLTKAILPVIGKVVSPKDVIKTNIRIDNPLYKTIK